ncbi:hypothetical protein [Mesorhizobium sp. M7A.F.Ca.US.010.02.1.1]|uniref:hypothetical protein n=1 Tax=Mesorhizobium sp. M7A.F.Ca.US.010.02.1.1 TaxID=2496743 RepID=UPI000FD21A64|nr:hypothetical protein [Mesorhizobium sp. M7A.F.Ca.US.010.02.1.1]RUW89174.1 hypothetical protein EOA19_26130 [Mesorhizobium sp. M7A.F.Ca.US.010.02.1.1]
MTAALAVERRLPASVLTILTIRCSESVVAAEPASAPLEIKDTLMLPESSGRAKRYSEIEKTAALKAYETKIAFGLTSTDAARKVSVPRKTLERWLDERKRHQEQTEASNGTRLIETSIATLAAPGRFNPEAVRSALFAFVAWLRWPGEVRNLAAYVLLLHCGYLVQKYGVSRLQELPESEKKAIQNDIDISLIFDLFLGKVVFPFHMDYEHEYYTRRDKNAEICSFFTNARHNSIDSSIGKAFHIVENNGFSKDFEMGEKAFRAFWRSNAAVMPFDYVELYHFPTLDLGLDPEEPDFYEKIDDLLQRLPEIAEYLAGCKWAVREFRSSLDPRALTSIWSPGFPLHLLPRELPRVKLPGKLFEALSRPRVIA